MDELRPIYSELRDALVAAVEDAARWRETKRLEYPEDSRNARSAEALRGFADFVRGIRDDNYSLTKLAVEYRELELAVNAPLPIGERANRELAQFGFHGGYDPAGFLRRLVNLHIFDLRETDFTPAQLKVIENRFRRLAARQGLKLVKSRSRDPRSLDFSTYTLIEAATDKVVVGPQLVLAQVGEALDDPAEGFAGLGA